MPDLLHAGAAPQDLSKREGVATRYVCNFPLARLVQIGDVVLVADDSVLYDTPLDGRQGYYTLIGMPIRARNGRFLGKVRTHHGLCMFMVIHCHDIRKSRGVRPPSASLSLRRCCLPASSLRRFSCASLPSAPTGI